MEGEDTHDWLWYLIIGPRVMALLAGVLAIVIAVAPGTIASLGVNDRGASLSAVLLGSAIVLLSGASLISGRARSNPMPGRVASAGR